MQDQSAGRLQGGPLLSAISNAVVRVQREYLGRGPTSARTSLNDNTLVVVLEETLTKAEQSLAVQGQAEHVLITRHKFQDAMRHDMVVAVEELTGRAVLAFMSANHLDPDMAAEIFVLEARPSTGASTADS
jgi:uncharacterized protein YbcI